MNSDSQTRACFIAAKSRWRVVPSCVLAGPYKPRHSLLFSLTSSLFCSIFIKKLLFSFITISRRASSSFLGLGKCRFIFDVWISSFNFIQQVALKHCKKIESQPPWNYHLKKNQLLMGHEVGTYKNVWLQTKYILHLKNLNIACI